MATTITFNDGAAATLSNGKSAPADRFANWTQKTLPVGDSCHRLSDEALYMFRTSTRYGASFELRFIPIAAVGGVRLVEVADRLIAHLKGGGTCTVNTGDSGSNSYTTCGLWPGSEPSLIQQSSGPLEYSLTLALINLAGSPSAMICRYV